MKSILIIDDTYTMKSYVEKFVAGYVVKQIYRLPDDESDLKNYDALVVDGIGIGNGKYRNGLEFCMAYDKPEGQAVVFHSGLVVHRNDAAELSRRGVAIVTKGGNPEKLALAVRFQIDKGE